MLFLRYKNELTLTQKKAPQRLDFCGASLMPNKNSFYPKLSPLLHSLFVGRSRFNQTQCKATATRFLHGHFGLAGYDTLLYLIRSRVLLVISIFTVGIESGYILLARFKEVERKVGCTCIRRQQTVPYHIASIQSLDWWSDGLYTGYLRYQT